MTEKGKSRRQRELDGGTRNAPVTDEIMDAVERHLVTGDRERLRQRGVVANGIADRAEEQRREAAILAVGEGHFADLALSTIGPTPEQMAKAPYAEMEIEAPGQTDRTHVALRNVTESRVVQLYKRGVIDGDQFAACNWYRNSWEWSGLDAAPATATFEENHGNAGAYYGHMPRSEAAAEARADFRFGRSFIPSDMIQLFEGVLLYEWTLAGAAAATRCRYANAVATFRHAAFALHGGIAHLLRVDGPWSEND